MAQRSGGSGEPASRPRGWRGAAEVARLRSRFTVHWRRARLLPPGGRVLVALSGGVDSTVLLHLLRFGEERPPLAAAHFDHGMRPGSGADAAWVAGLCRGWEIPLETGRPAVPLRTEADARAARYAFLEAAARRAGADAVATAHHLDDQAETVLFRAARGAGIRGLAGIAPKRGNIVRPLLPFARAELVAYARATGLRWREDPTNVLAAYTRNRIRREVLPALEQAVPGAARALARLATHARATERGWDDLLDQLLVGVLAADTAAGAEVARERLVSYPSEVQSRLLRHLLRRHGFAPGWAGTRAAVEFINSGNSGRHLRLAGGVRLEHEFDTILVRWPGVAPVEERRASIERPGSGEAQAVIGGCECLVRWSTEPPAAAGTMEAFDPAVARFPLVLRGWRPGDRIRLAAGTKKLKKLFAERRVRRGARRGVPVLADAEGRVLWVVGIARAPGARPVPGQPALFVTVINVGA